MQSTGIEMIQIYALRHPKTGEVRYVGQTSQKLSIRLSQHWHRAQSGYHSPVHCWMRRDGKPNITLLQSHASQTDETKWIDYFSDRLLNLSRGGNANRGYKLSKLTRSRISTSLVGNTRTRGHRHSESTKLAMSESKIGNTNATNNKSRKNKGRKVMDTNTGVIYQTVTAASNANKINRSSMTVLCQSGLNKRFEYC